MYYGKIYKTDLVNGEGIRVTIFVSGCTLNCDGCFNKESQNFRYGEEYTAETEKYILTLLERKNISGLSICGGDPLEPKNLGTVTELARKVKDKFPEKNIWLWTGREYNDIKDYEIMKYLDVVIDGKFEKDLKEKLPFRGSSNQKIIRIQHA